MKNVSKRIQRMGERAAEIRHVVETLPAKAADLRGVVTTAAGQVRGIREDLVSGVSAVRGASDVETAATLREIEGAAEVLKEAGYRLAGIDLEVVAGRRVLARLVRTESVNVEDLRVVSELYAKTPVAKRLVAGLVHAAEIAAGIKLTQLDLAEVIVDVGAGQAVRIGWRAEVVARAGAGVRVVPPPLPGAGVAGGEPRPPTFAQSTFFARPEGAAATVPGATGVAVAAGVASPTRVESAREVEAKTAVLATAASAAKGTGAQSRSSALDRFKKMPDLTKKAGTKA